MSYFNACRTAALAILGCAMIAMYSGCASDSGPSEDVFDRPTMLRKVADQLIVPSYQQLLDRCITLDSAVAQLAAAPSSERLEASRSAWAAAMLAWANAVTYNFGPAEGLYGTLATNIGTFPSKTDSIDARIARNDTTTVDFQRDVRGFMALDYLLFADGDQTLSLLTQSAPRMNYVVSVARKILAEVRTVHSGWNSGYRTKFIEQTGTDIGSSYSLLLNNMNRSYEDVKNYKVGLPAGLMAGHTTHTSPKLVEAYHSGLSLRMIKAHMAAVIQLRLLAFEDYVASIDGGSRLNADTHTQEQALITALDAVPTTPALSVQVQVPDEAVKNLHTEFLKLTRFYKSELASLIGISITYSSGDGD